MYRSVELSMNSGVASAVSISGHSGSLTITDSDHVDDVITIEVSEGTLVFDSTCIAGTMVARGSCKFTNNSTGATVIDETINIDNMWNKIYENISEFATAVWNKVIA